MENLMGVAWQGCRRKAGRGAPPGEDSHTGSASHVDRGSRMNYAQVTDWHTRTP